MSGLPPLARIGGAALLLPLGLAGCSPPPSALDPEGPLAGSALDLFVLFNIVSALVLAGVVAALGVAIARRRRDLGERDDEPLAPDPRHERLTAMVVIALTVATVAILVALTVASFVWGRAESLLAARDPEMLTVKVAARQWWWEFTYESAEPAQQIVTANELHIPTGRPVRLRLQSSDVIHAFWVPALAGKRDLIPGRTNELVIEAARPGVYRGQCAEFCGLQHAHMALTVVAEAPDAFEAWRRAQLAPAETPAPDDPRGRGLQVFLASPCASCHRVRGTPAGAANGPDLTHLASRSTIAAGTLPMTRGHLAAWIADPQTLKPGTRMPRVPLSGPDLQALVSYLEGLT